MNITAVYRARIKEIKETDKVIPFRNPDDMKFGTLEILQLPTGFEVLGLDKKNGNRIRFAKIIRENAHKTDTWKPWRHIND